MEGYAVVTTDDKRVGHVVGMEGDYYIVESGSVLGKSRHPVPKEYATVDATRECVLIRISTEVLRGAPKLGRDGRFDETAAADYYGLA